MVYICLFGRSTAFWCNTHERESWGVHAWVLGADRNLSGPLADNGCCILLHQVSHDLSQVACLLSTDSYWLQREAYPSRHLGSSPGCLLEFALKGFVLLFRCCAVLLFAPRFGGAGFYGLLLQLLVWTFVTRGDLRLKLTLVIMLSVEQLKGRATTCFGTFVVMGDFPVVACVSRYAKLAPSTALYLYSNHPFSNVSLEPVLEPLTDP